MSFDVNIGRSSPMIKAATGKNNDGGSGGNTGFLRRGRRKKEKQQGLGFSLFEVGSGFIDCFEMKSKLPGKDFDESSFKASWLDKLMGKAV
ncbi:hypothetical protein IJ579_01580 [bacterium]|nr:hypothetical protein [bacterium]